MPYFETNSQEGLTCGMRVIGPEMNAMFRSTSNWNPLFSSTVATDMSGDTTCPGHHGHGLGLTEIARVKLEVLPSGNSQKGCY